ncbi:hypothetical protein A6A06_19460 [Streptomyces sp. CB02923]|uniref:DUF5955 family protein n=1 Tax=Streptomyces sp. CB02923 TaxID=1718985 RepID=UPI00093D89C5|nr:DUF5955 family protein [Streptomyces sp. CB02923]OKI01404.1 hypothetical protein A6A06_19460 [Streptomyces sp. CB02923]
MKQRQKYRRVAEAGDDPRGVALCGAVARLRRELAVLPAELPDRAAADDELAALHAMVSAGDPEVPRLRRSLLLIAGAVGSISALAPALTDLRELIGLYGEAPRRF